MHITTEPVAPLFTSALCQDHSGTYSYPRKRLDAIHLSGKRDFGSQPGD